MVAEKRKLMEVGGSYLVALPKWWCRKHSMKAGDYVDIEERDSGVLLVRPGEPPEKRS